jgi:hypothetical protein
MIQDWIAPNDIDDGLDRRRTLIAEIEEIDAQLRDKDKRKEMGEDSWWRWRKKAIWAKTHRSQDLRLTKEWIYNNGD